MNKLALLILLCAAVASAETRRLAIVVGNNAGTGEMPPLRYAESDAGKMARVMVELGDVLAEDVMLLQGQGVDQVERAITEVRDRVAFFKKSPDVRTVVFFYFSGHSDGEAIELGHQKLAYARLKALLSGTGGDVRLVVVDACRSGAGLREKGGKPADTFTIRLADTLQTTGEAFITSSAADEASLESSEVMGSYFTHNLISGMRGAADASGDKLVTLAEAYKYAYDRTVVSTAMLPVGAQHPNYDFKLSGQGELVLATLLKPSSVLVLPEADRSLVIDLARDQVIVEVVGGAREVALSAGHYGLRLFKGGQGYGGRVTLTDGMRHVVQMSAMTPIHSSVVVAAKGGPLVVQRMDSPRSRAEAGVGVSLGGTGRILAPQGTAQGPKWQLRADVEPLTTTFASFSGGRFSGTLHLLALGEMSFDANPPGGEAANEAGAQLRVGYRLAVDLWRVQLGLGVELGPGVLAQLYEARAMTVVFAFAPRMTLKVRIAPSVALIASGDFSFTGLNYGATASDSGFNWFVYPSLSAGLMVFF
ncbi:MAG: caspase family protein [Archangium sp.]|nr:caspase family protein [Archangium sp.]MDP3157039.1 caspase family protein [Archangium sp.]MDP3575756.1 caspase family protein [Archangium sp.]